MNLRFIKPSHTFYNSMMSHWFKYLCLKQEEQIDYEKQLDWDNKEITSNFIQFCINNMKKLGQWNECFYIPLDSLSNIIVKQYC